MKTVFDHINHIKGKPHHVRKRIAFGTAMGGTALIALLWAGLSLSTGAFVIHPTSLAQSTGDTEVTVAGTDNGNENLAGASAAQTQDQSGPARIQIITLATSTQQAEQTTIPF